MRNLTVRLDELGVVASDDDGYTVTLSEDLAISLADAYGRGSATRGSGTLTAATRGALGEARRAKPNDSPEPAPSWRTSTDGRRLKLGPYVHDGSNPLADVLTRRRSKRDWAAPTLASLATVVVRCARVVDWSPATDGYTSTRRPTPSAGARHPFDLYILARQVHGLAPGAWKFDPLTCDLTVTEIPSTPALSRFAEIVDAKAPPAALVLVGHLDRTLSRYPTGLSLLWRDAGALLALLHLSAVDLHLASCIVGSCGVFLDDKHGKQIDMGALLVGADPSRRVSHVDECGASCARAHRRCWPGSQPVRHPPTIITAD